MVSDGGLDHNVTFGSVKLALTALFFCTGIAIRTCLYQSWHNMAKRVMSTLNHALQNVSLARKLGGCCRQVSSNEAERWASYCWLSCNGGRTIRDGWACLFHWAKPSEGDPPASAFNKTPGLHKFIESHCLSSHYVFQLKHCSQHPVQTDTEQFRALLYPPLPLLDERKENFVPFNEGYGQPLSRKNRLSRGQFTDPDVKGIYKNHKQLFVKSKVRTIIHC